MSITSQVEQIRNTRGKKVKRPGRDARWGLTEEDFQRKVITEFGKGLQQARVACILAHLKEKGIRNQYEIADELMLQDRSGVTKIEKSLMMQGWRVDLVQHRLRIPEPTAVIASIYGVANTATSLRVLAGGKRKERLSAQGFADLVGMMAEECWEEVRKNPDRNECCAAAERILEEQALRESEEREATMADWLYLDDLWKRWLDFGLVSLMAVGEYLPESALLNQ